MDPEQYENRIAQRHAAEARQIAHTLRANGAAPPPDVLARLLCNLANYAEREATR